MSSSRLSLVGTPALAFAALAVACGSSTDDVGPPPGAPACASVAGDGALGPSGYPLDGWAWEKLGPLADMPEPAIDDGDLSPALVVVDARIHLFFARKRGLEHRIQHAVSDDGRVFDSATPVVGLGAGTMLAYPTVTHDGTRFRMWFASGSIDYAESYDGVAWVGLTTGVLRLGPADGFDQWGVLYPSVVVGDTDIALWYTGFDGLQYVIGRATSQDGRSFVRTPSVPVLAAGRASDFDNRSVAQSNVVRTDRGLFMWYGGYDTSATDPGPWRIGLATSADGLTWERRGVTIDLSLDGSDAQSTRDPAVIRWQDRWVMAYSGYGSDHRYRLHLATSRACVP
jgi:predicted GH43/DUF377 family glycosyl hydrolase